MDAIREIEHKIIFKDPFAYSAHPFIARVANGDWLVVFNQSVRRPVILHPPEDPLYHNFMLRSTDQGASWKAPRVVPGYDWHGTECAGLTPLADGAVLLNQWRFKWHPLETALKLQPGGDLSFPHDWVAELQASGELDSGYKLADSPDELIPWARTNGGTFVHRSSDMGRTWDATVEVDTQPYSGGYGMRGGVQLDNGDVLLPLSDVPKYETVFVTRSTDGGRTFGNIREAAHLPGHFFEEPSALQLPSGDILMLVRDNATHSLYQVLSKDGGHTWSAAAPTGIRGYPAHLLLLPDGRLFCVFGVRYAPFGIRAVLSRDQGKTWDVGQPLVLRDDLRNWDLGYPSAIRRDDGRIFVVYYAQDVDGVTCIQTTSFFLR